MEWNVYERGMEKFLESFWQFFRQQTQHSDKSAGSGIPLVISKLCAQGVLLLGTLVLSCACNVTPANTREQRIVIKKLCLLISSWTVISLSACSNPKLQSEISDLNGASTAVAGQIDTFYSKLNDSNRDLYIEQVKITKGAKLVPVDDGKTAASDDSNQPAQQIAASYFVYFDDTDKQQLRTGLTQFYPTEYIKIRSLALQGLTEYVGKLNALATSSASTDIGNASKSLGSDLGTLASQINSIASEGSKRKTTLSPTTYSQPLGELGNLVGTTWIDFLRNKWMKDSVKQTASCFDNLIQILIDDVSKDAARTKTRAARTLAMYEQYYNGKDSGLSDLGYADKGKPDFLTEAEKIAKVQADIDAADPTALLQKMKTAHDNLTGYVSPVTLQSSEKTATIQPTVKKH